MTQHLDNEGGWSPWASEAEQSVLGALLIDNDALARITGLIDARSFWHAPHRLIFAAIERQVLASKPADVVTVFEALREADQAVECGGLEHLNALAMSVPSSANIRRYAEIVADKALRRIILATADSLPSMVQDAQTADEALDRAQALLASVKRTKAGREPRTVGALMAARIDHWQALAAGDATPGIPTGFERLDGALGGGLKAGRVIVLAARPSVGKTSLATQLLLHVGQQGQPGLLLSQEMGAGELMDRAAAHLSGINLDRFGTGRLEGNDWEQVADVAERAAALPVYVDDQTALTLLDIRAKARQVQRAAGGRLALLVVDYLQLCASTLSAEKRHHQIEQLSRGMKALAKELDVCVLLLSQLKRDGGEPELDHLKESGAIEEDADTVVLLHPMGEEPDRSMLVLAKIAKNRGGRRGRLALNFQGRTQRWTESNASVARRTGGAG